MSLQELLSDEAWDKPFFKRLAHNDTGAAPGHQAGFVVPQVIRKFFPVLTGKTGAVFPTIDFEIAAVLVHEGHIVDRVRTRYQYQTWGGTRSPESRITGNLTTLLRLAQGGDYLVMQRRVDSLNTYRFILVCRGTEDYAIVHHLVGEQRWGCVSPETPLAYRDLDLATVEQSAREAGPFELFEKNARTGESRVKRIARCQVFRSVLLDLYQYRCCVCRTGLAAPDGTREVEAAHIVPRSRRGSDDCRNGLALCKRDHWAFDRGLFGLSAECRIVVPSDVFNIPQNEHLRQLKGQKILDPIKLMLAPSAHALKWHRENVLMQ